jgi:predicted nucleotidyltransferase component of viral defense system
MLNAEEIRRIARQVGYSAGIVEKDYAISWLLAGLFEADSRAGKSLVFKGGTALNKIFFPRMWRLSEDMDFTMLGGSSSDVKEGYELAFERVASQSGLRFSFDDFHATPGSVIASVQYRGPLISGNRIKQDVSLNEKLVLKPEMRKLKTVYPDVPSVSVRVYALKEILVEKIRSIMQRGYARDYYDAWRLLKLQRFDSKEIGNLLKKKCEVNEVLYDEKVVFDSARIAEARRFWQKGLGYLTKDLPDFELVQTELRDSLGPVLH